VPQLNMYTPIHKGLRNLLFTTSLAAGSIDWNEEARLSELQHRIEHLLHVLRLHVRNEETYVHPLLADRLVGVHKRLEAAHREQEGILDDLESFLARARAADPEKRVQLGLELYRVLNRFIALYLPHLDDEETRVMPALNEAFTPEELIATYFEILRNQQEPDLLSDVDMMFPAMTDDEVIELLQTGPSWMAPALMEKAGQRAERAMGPDRWGRIMDRMGAAAAAR
jgi:hemerythrin-like domain-containing protein